MKTCIGVLAAIGVMAGLAAPAADAQNCCKNGVPRPWAKYNLGVKWVNERGKGWETNLPRAQEEAKKSGKLIYLFQLVGQLDEEGS